MQYRINSIKYTKRHQRSFHICSLLVGVIFYNGYIIKDCTDIIFQVPHMGMAVNSSQHTAGQLIIFFQNKPGCDIAQVPQSGD